MPKASKQQQKENFERSYDLAAKLCDLLSAEQNPEVTERVWSMDVPGADAAGNAVVSLIDLGTDEQDIPEGQRAHYHLVVVRLPDC
jgi:hypothetical protein